MLIERTQITKTLLMDNDSIDNHIDDHVDQEIQDCFSAEHPKYYAKDLQ